jgi:EF-P lysine aminoacylase GenX
MKEPVAIDDERPTASLATLRMRARLLAETRRFFDDAGFFEVDTPLLSADRVIDPHLEPFVARGAESASAGAKPVYLQTSPEFAMKRLLCEGAEAIYQLGKVFRAGERGTRHNPEFTMLEWYRIGDDHHAAMRLTEAYLRTLASSVSQSCGVAGVGLQATNAPPQSPLSPAGDTPDANDSQCGGEGWGEGAAAQPMTLELAPSSALRAPSPPQSSLPCSSWVGSGGEGSRADAGENWGSAPFRTINYRDAFRNRLNLDPLRDDTTKLIAAARTHCSAIPEGFAVTDRDAWLNLLLAECIEPNLGTDRPEFLVDYPASQGALARLRTEPDGTHVAERFELYWRGVELCNGYHELTDAAELRSRIAAETTRRASEGLPPLDTDNRLLRAMDRGLPPCAGNAVGFDRVIMLLLGFERIDDVVPFPFERA